MTPTFFTSLDDLKAELRLTGLSTNSDAEAIFLGALREVKADLIGRLGFSRITAIKATTFTEDPTTTAEWVRLIGNVAEAVWMRLSVLTKLRAVFMDSTGNALKEWNENGFLREMSNAQLENLLSDLRAELERWLEVLETGNYDAASEIRSFDGTPDFCPPKLGGSLARNASELLKVQDQEDP